jgi:hypothetical protein
MKIPLHSALAVSIFIAPLFSEDALRNNDTETIAPLVFHNKDSVNYIYIESDGRHVTAFSPIGKILWHEDLFVAAGLKPYRVTKPVIWTIQRTKYSPTGLSVTFNSTQEVSLDPDTGKSTQLSQR